VTAETPDAILDEYLHHRDAAYWNNKEKVRKLLTVMGLVESGKVLLAPSTPPSAHECLLRASRDIAAAAHSGWLTRVDACIAAVKHGLREDESTGLPSKRQDLATLFGISESGVSKFFKEPYSDLTRARLEILAKKFEVDADWLINGHRFTKRNDAFVLIIPTWLLPHAHAFETAWTLVSKVLLPSVDLIRAANRRRIELPNIDSPARYWLCLLSVLKASGKLSPCPAHYPFICEFPRVYPLVQEAERTLVNVQCSRHHLNALIRAAVEWDSQFTPPKTDHSDMAQSNLNNSSIREALVPLQRHLWLEQDSLVVTEERRPHRPTKPKK